MDDAGRILNEDPYLYKHTYFRYPGLKCLHFILVRQIVRVRVKLITGDEARLCISALAKLQKADTKGARVGSWMSHRKYGVCQPPSVERKMITHGIIIK